LAFWGEEDEGIVLGVSGEEAFHEDLGGVGFEVVQGVIFEGFEGGEGLAGDFGEAAAHMF
jgi:hypothetical protein